MSLSVTKSAYYLNEPLPRHLLDFSLGHDARSLEVADGIYWNEEASKLEQLLIENPYHTRLAKVLLMGDYVQDETFGRILKKVLGYPMENLLKILSEDSKWVAAKGAAEYAKGIPSDSCKV